MNCVAVRKDTSHISECLGVVVVGRRDMFVCTLVREIEACMWMDGWVRDCITVSVCVCVCKRGRDTVWVDGWVRERERDCMCEREIYIMYVGGCVGV